MPSMSAGLRPASAIALSAASACNWICDMSGMTPSWVVSAAPTMAMDFGFIGSPPLARCQRGQHARRCLAQICLDRRIVRRQQRAEEREGDLVIELLEGNLDRHVELQCLGGLWAFDDVGHHARPLVELDD